MPDPISVDFNEELLRLLFQLSSDPRGAQVRSNFSLAISQHLHATHTIMLFSY